MVCRGPQLVLPRGLSLRKTLSVLVFPCRNESAWISPSRKHPTCYDHSMRQKQPQDYTQNTLVWQEWRINCAGVCSLVPPGTFICEFQFRSYGVSWTELYLLLSLLLPLWPSMTSTPGATTTNSAPYSSAFTTTAIMSHHFKTQSLTSLCTNPSPPPPSRSNWKSNLSQCCVQVERRTATTACSLFRSLSTAHICIDLSSFWAGGTGGSNTKRLIPIDLHRALRFHSSFIW